MSQDNRRIQNDLERNTLVIAEEMYNLACDKYTPLTDRTSAAEAFAILVQPIL